MGVTPDKTSDARNVGVSPGESATRWGALQLYECDSVLLIYIYIYI